jgi:hypothetical protein
VAKGFLTLVIGQIEVRDIIGGERARIFFALFLYSLHYSFSFCSSLLLCFFVKSKTQLSIVWVQVDPCTLGTRRLVRHVKPAGIRLPLG